MPLSFILALVGVAAYFAVAIAALLLHGIWVAPFIERHGERTAGFAAHWILKTGLIRDYQTARRICRERGLRPWWLSWFTGLLTVAGVLAAGIVLFILLSFRYK